MKTFQQLILTIILASGCLFIACDLSDPCRCPPIDGEFFNIHGLFVRPTSTLTGTMSAGEEIAFEDFTFFHVDFDVNFVAQLFEARSNPWINSAYACSCLFNGMLGAKDEGFASFTVTTLNDYDEEYKAGDVINDIMNTLGSIADGPLTNYLEETKGSLIESENLFLTLDRAPTANKEVRLGFRIELTNGEVYELETVPVVLN